MLSSNVGDSRTVVGQGKDSFGKSADQNGSSLVANKDHLRGPRVSKDL